MSDDILNETEKEEEHRQKALKAITAVINIKCNSPNVVASVLVRDLLHGLVLTIRENEGPLEAAKFLSLSLNSILINTTVKRKDQNKIIQ